MNKVFTLKAQCQTPESFKQIQNEHGLRFHNMIVRWAET